MARYIMYFIMGNSILLEKLKEHGIYRSFALLFLSSVFSLFVLALRMAFTGTYRYMFLNWNLFLAAVPWVVTTILLLYPGIAARRIRFALLLLVWLLFLPNAPYIITDLLHLNYWNGPNVWFDLVLIFSYAWTGLMFGFFSIINMESILSKSFSTKVINVISSVALFACGFGIYLGRYARWNSWDIIQSPFSLIADIADRFIHPFDHPRTWAMTILGGILLNIIYFSMKPVRNQKNIYAGNT